MSLKCRIDIEKGIIKKAQNLVINAHRDGKPKAIALGNDLFISIDKFQGRQDLAQGYAKSMVLKLNTNFKEAIASRGQIPGGQYIYIKPSDSLVETYWQKYKDTYNTVNKEVNFINDEGDSDTSSQNEISEQVQKIDDIIKETNRRFEKENSKEIQFHLSKPTPKVRSNITVKLGRTSGDNQNVNVFLGKEQIVDENSEDFETGQSQVIIRDMGSEIVVNFIQLPIEIRGIGIASEILQKIANITGKPVVNSMKYKEKLGPKYTQTEDGSKIWKNRTSFNPSNKTQFNVDYSLKSVKILSSPEADETFRKGDKNGWSIDKILTELQIPKEQKDLILSFGTRNREEILTNLLANYSHTVEINTAIATKSIAPEESEFYTDRGIISQEKGQPTQYYSNLTVPGGTNYTENEISTPGITPSIKGHAQFSTDNGIGWFRSDDKYPFTGFLEDLIASGTIKKVPCG